MTAFIDISIVNKFVYLPRGSPLVLMMHFFPIHLKKPTMSDPHMTTRNSVAFLVTPFWNRLSYQHNNCALTGMITNIS